MPTKSIFRQPGAQHFQLVHRSQRDPLIHDPESSQHVLKPVVRENVKKGKSRAELENLLSSSDLTLTSGRSTIGEASLYGVYFDDTQYDYMQHLRQIDKQEEGSESILIEAPKRRVVTRKAGDFPKSLHDLPPEAFPSASELPRDFESQTAIQSSISGLQPDMDPHLRQTLEALEDDAYIEDDLDDNFFGELIKDGERSENDPFEYGFKEDGLQTDGSDTGKSREGDNYDETGWEARFAAFKRGQQGRKAIGASFSGSEKSDTVGQMPEFPVTGKSRLRRTSDASGYSMSSASVFRSNGLRDLDDRFDQIEKEYMDMEDKECEDERPDSDNDSTPEFNTSREDFDSLMNDFLHNYEVSGGKMKPSLHGSGPEKLQSLRLAMGRDERVVIQDPNQEYEDGDIYSAIEGNGKRERWDVETVLTTYTNLENHPRLIRARSERKGPTIRLDPKTGFPLADGKATPRLNDPQTLLLKETHAPHNITRRPREESSDERRERKHAVKMERQARRVKKKETKEQFSAAVKQQTQALAKKDAQARKL